MEGYYTNDSKMDEFDKTEMNFYMTMLRNTINQIQKEEDKAKEKDFHEVGRIKKLYSKK